MRRCMMFLPGVNPGNIQDADVFGADALIFDLEDAVSLTEKDAGRILTRNALLANDYPETETIVRVNDLSSPFCQDDLEAIVPAKPNTLILPKVNTAGDVKTISARVAEIERSCGLKVGGINFITLMETCEGIENALEIARSDPRVDTLYLGAGDLALNMKAIRTPEALEILYARTRIIYAARAAGISVMDTPYIENIHDLTALRAECLMAKKMGFDGKAAIHPAQVAIIKEVFSPSKELYEYSLELMVAVEKAEKAGKGIIVFNGKQVDRVQIIEARQLIDEYESFNQGRVK
jgi:citrate lyase subunit beta/citryl-CoA lyase